MGISEEINEALEKRQIVIGMNSTMNALKKGLAKKIIFTKNCAKEFKNEIKELCKISNCEHKEFNGTNIELGVLCKKPFSISVLAILKGEKE
jgi:large subunit ribosomal protein L30e